MTNAPSRSIERAGPRSTRLKRIRALVPALALLCFAAACAEGRGARSAGDDGARPGARLAAATPSEEGARTLTRRARLRYEIHERPFPLPVVRGTIAGRPTLMLVDTGANSHIITGWLARELGLPMKALGEIGADHVGKAIATYRIDDPKMTIEGWGSLSAGPALATEVPDVIEKLGIGAFVSPQRLDEEGDAVVLDLAGGELRSAWWDEAYAELAERGAPLAAERDVAVCEERDGPVRGLAFVLSAAVDAHRVSLLVDTGAQRSDVFTSTAVGQRLLAQSTSNKEAMYTASGRISGRVRRGARVEAGSFAITTDVDLVHGAADRSCPRDGVLAMDVLRSCALLMGRSRFHGWCM